MGSKRNGGERVVVQLSKENYLAVEAAIILPGSNKAPFGARSKFINLVLDEWRARRALQGEAQ
jgi:hypothetical protein